MPQQTEIKIKGKSKLLEGLNAEQEKAVTHADGPLLIVAGAGTGKTTVITRRIAYLIEQGVKPEEILALAFGEKAAGEMEERVDQLLPTGYVNVQISTYHSFGEQIFPCHALAFFQAQGRTGFAPGLFGLRGKTNAGPGSGGSRFGGKRRSQAAPGD